jgi:L-asparagine transporter-like permease
MACRLRKADISAAEVLQPSQLTSAFSLITFPSSTFYLLLLLQLLRVVFCHFHRVYNDTSPFSMAVNEGSVATAALAIAISALVIAVGQFLSQLFSTADGYRRCQPSVIGNGSDWWNYRLDGISLELSTDAPSY